MLATVHKPYAWVNEIPAHASSMAWRGRGSARLSAWRSMSSSRPYSAASIASAFDHWREPGTHTAGIDGHTGADHGVGALGHVCITFSYDFQWC